mgnify:CR=1 FL=1
MDTSQSPAGQEVNQEILTALVAAGLENLRVPSSRSEWQALSMYQQAQVAHVAPGFAQGFADVADLPAGTRLRLELDQLEMGDMSALEAAGFVQTARELMARSKAQALAEFEARTDERMASIQAEREAAAQGSEAAARASMLLARDRQRAATRAREGW